VKINKDTIYVLQRKDDGTTRILSANPIFNVYEVEPNSGKFSQWNFDDIEFAINQLIKLFGYEIIQEWK
jgi:hypothetical protein